MNIDIIYIALVIVIVLLSLTFHEAMHAFVGYWLGDDTAKMHGRLTFNPIKHIDPFLTILLPITLALIGAPIFGGAKPVPFNPNKLKYDEWGPALVAVAGPLTNLFIAFIIFGISVAVGHPIGFYAGDYGLWDMILELGVIVNLGFFAFNIIPIPPLDGSRILYALAPDFARRVMESIERYGTSLVFAVIILFGSAFGTLMSKIITIFIDLFGRIFGL